MESFSHERKRPHEFWEHLDRAQVELLEAFRSLIDHKIDKVKRRKQEVSEGLSKIEIDEGE
jgi:hypothetical protein